MNSLLNFGPSEQTSAQRQEIADRALVIVLEEEREAKVELLVMYEKYVAGEVDLYAVSVHVGEQTRKKLLALKEANRLTQLGQ